MPLVSATVQCRIEPSFRVKQVAGMFDLALSETAEETFAIELPSLEEEWSIGAIVGPSGSGKSTIAASAYGGALYRSSPASDWPPDRAVVDAFGDLPIKQIAYTLTAVGFSSPPAWIKPYAVLSNGEKFRCDLARALLLGSGADVHGRTRTDTDCHGPTRAQADSLDSRLRGNDDIVPQSPAPNPQSPPAALVVFDEFTSVVDRTVAQVGSAAVAKAIRSGRIARRFVAVSCHYDILPWLEPDWVADMATCTLKRGRLRRPSITLEVVRCRQSAWRLFARHHYLSGSIPCFAQCYLALWNGEPVAFCAVSGMYGYRNRKRVARTVTLPDYQGLGIGTRLMQRVCEHEISRGYRVSITTSHPAMIAYCKSSPRWRTTCVKKFGYPPARNHQGVRIRASLGRSVVSFEFVPRVECQESRVESRKR